MFRALVGSLALLGMVSPVQAGEIETHSQILEAAAHVLESADNVPWTSAVIGGASEAASLSILLDDSPSLYAGASCADGALPRICEVDGDAIRCSTPALEALIALDSGRGHPSVPLLHALAQEIGHLSLSAPEVKAESLKLSMSGKTTAQRIAAIQGVLEQHTETAAAEAQADKFADIVLARRLKEVPYNVSDITVHRAVLESARTQLAERAECALDDAPEVTASERDLQRSARQLLCAATNDGEVMLAAFEGSHADWPGRMKALSRTLGKEAPDIDTESYYRAVSETLARQAKIGSWPPACGAMEVEQYLSRFDDVPMVCPRMVAGMTSGDWTPIARIPTTTTGDQLSVRSSSVMAPVLPSGRVGLILPEKQQVGTWTVGEPIASLTRLPCTPTGMVESGDSVVVSCESPAGMVEVADGKIRAHLVSEVSYDGEVQPTDGVSTSWIGEVDGRIWLTGSVSSHVGFGWDVTDPAQVTQLAAWKGEGCDMLAASGDTRMWRGAPEGEVHGMSAEKMGFVFRVSPEGELVGRASPRAWEEFAYEMDLTAGQPMGCGPGHLGEQTVCLDSQAQVFDPTPDPPEFVVELSSARSLRGEDPQGMVCDSSKAKYALFHDVNGAEKEAWVIRYSEEDGIEELMVRPNIAEATLSCGEAGAAVTMGNAELTRVIWLR